MPFGICSASDVAQKMVDDEFSDIPGALAVHDDIIVSGANTEEHDIALEKVLHRARERNIKFNKKKIQLRVTEVKYLSISLVLKDSLLILRRLKPLSKCLYQRASKIYNAY